MRLLGEDGIATHEVVAARGTSAEDSARPLLVPLVRSGEVVGREPLAAARQRHNGSLAELPAQARQLSRGEPAIPTVYRDHV
jgi:nicotinate phosphoribosyltransferase